MINLEFERRRRGWTQMQLSHVTRIAQTFISEIERGVMRPGPDQLRRLAVALDLPEDIVLKPATKPMGDAPVPQ